jgi:mono/diheme cytochrome c family protein
VLNGLSGPIEVKGATFNGAMFAFKDMPLKDEDIANVLTYVRNTWGNKAPGVKPEQVKAIRGEVSSRALPWTSAELQKVSVE